jgi:hypothetical protein
MLAQIRYPFRRNSEARTRSRICSDFSRCLSRAGGAAGFGFTAVGSAAFAGFFTILRAAICANRLVAKSLACASTGSAKQLSVLPFDQLPICRRPRPVNILFHYCGDAGA